MINKKEKRRKKIRKGGKTPRRDKSREASIKRAFEI